MAIMKVFKNNKFPTLNSKQIIAIELIINGEETREKIAEKVGVTRKTLYNWERHNEEFRHALEWYRREIYRDYAPEAVRTVVEIMQSGEEKYRLAAAEKIISLVGDDVTKIDFDGENKLEVDIKVVE